MLLPADVRQKEGGAVQRLGDLESKMRAGRREVDEKRRENRRD